MSYLIKHGPWERIERSLGLITFGQGSSNVPTLLVLLIEAKIPDSGPEIQREDHAATGERQVNLGKSERQVT